jgi:hypothetical protein
MDGLLTGGDSTVHYPGKTPCYDQANETSLNAEASDAD